MTEPDQSNLKERILQFLAKHPNEQFKPSVISRRLSLKGDSDYRLLQRALNELHQASSIARGKGRRYGHAQPPRSHQFPGVLTLTRQGTGIVRLLPPHEGVVMIPQKFLDTGLDGDIVSVGLFAHPEDPGKPKGANEQPAVEGEIIEVVERSAKPIVGIFQKSKNFFFVVPDDRKVGRDVYIPQGKTGGARPGQKVIAPA